MGTTTLNYFTNETPLYLVKQHISVLLDEITYLYILMKILSDHYFSKTYYSLLNFLLITTFYINHLI